MANVTVYVMTVWHNLPTKDSAIDATNLNHLEQGIKNVTDFVNTINASSGIYLSQTPFTTALKNKLDGIEAQANKYVLPKATTSALGGVIVDGTTITVNNDGKIHAVASSTALSALTDVNLIDLADGQILKYDAASQKWINTSEAEVRTQLSLLEDVDIDELTLADGQTLKWDATNSKWVNGEGGDVLDYNETLQALGDPAQNVPSIPVVYSTTEQKVGVWHDGRPLYERTFDVVYETPTTIAINSEVTLDADFSDMALYDTLFQVSKLCCYANNGVDNYMADSNTVIQQTSYQSKGLYIFFAKAMSNVTRLISTVRYTKSTDPIPSS